MVCARECLLSKADETSTLLRPRLSPVCHPFLGLVFCRRATTVPAHGARGIKTSTQPNGNQNTRHHSIMKQQVFLFLCAVLLGGAVVWLFTRKDAPAIPLNSVPGPTATKQASQTSPPSGIPDPPFQRTQTAGLAARNGEQEQLMEQDFQDDSP